MKRFLITILAVGFCGTLNAQVVKTSEHPFFKAMLGNCVEKGKLLLPGASEPMPMEITMNLKPALDGVWVQEDGEAVSPKFSFKFRWMFRVVKQQDGEIVIARFITSQGQVQDYMGSFSDEKTLVLQRKTKEGNYQTTVAQIAADKWTITTLFQPTGSDKPITIYQSEKTKAGA